MQNDIDNVVKTIPDGLKQVIYANDGEIYKLTGQKINLKTYAYVVDLSLIVVTALHKYEALVQVALTGGVKEDSNANRTSVGP